MFKFLVEDVDGYTIDDATKELAPYLKACEGVIKEAVPHTRASGLLFVVVECPSRAHALKFWLEMEPSFCESPEGLADAEENIFEVDW